MATHASDKSTRTEELTDFRGGSKLIGAGAVLAVIGLGAAIGLGMGGEFPFRRFLFGYLAGYVFVLAIALGCLAFVILQHLTRAAWSVGVRRTAENFAATLPLLAVLGLPMVISAVSGHGYLYRWALPMTPDRVTAQTIEAAEHNEMELEPKPSQAAKLLEEEHPEVAAPSDPSKLQLDPLDLAKRNYGLHWLNPSFFVVRIVLYGLLWSGIAIWFRRKSLEQDRTGDDSLTLKMQAAAAPCAVILGLTITGAAFDLLMSLDPHWYSTMFGVYYIAETFLASYATLIITVFFMHRAGYLRQSILIEHYHDLGKYLFAFTFFFGYIAFSQYMLLWYANVPEETIWMARHGASTAIHNGWNGVIVAILFCHILIPFGGLLSRHIKRRPAVLLFWAFWQLLFVAVDMYWIVLPEMGPTGPEASTVLVTICSAVGLGGVLFAAFGFLASKASLRPTRDPRLADSLVFTNI